MSLPPPKPSPIAPGYRLDRYEFLWPIAEGGMATVWVARLQGKHGFEKMVAIKTILPKYSSDEMFQKMFLDEARISSGIKHPSVAQILDLGDDRGILYLVMEWVDGDSLGKLARAVERAGAAFPYGISLRIVADACAGLHAAHELRGKDGASLGVVHRDVSPQNILIASEGTAKIIDFGIAAARDRLSGETSNGLIKGKVDYMAPEQAFGQPTDRRADVWSIGAVLYYLVCGKPPYRRDSQLATLHALTSGQPPAPLPPHVPVAIQRVIGTALSYDRAQRYGTAAEMHRALEQAMQELGVATTIYDVAEFNANYLAERARAREQSLELALSAAAERARVEVLLQPNASDTESVRINGKMAFASGASGSQPDARRAERATEITAGARRVPAMEGEEPAAVPSSPVSDVSLATIGGAGSMTSSVERIGRAGGRKRTFAIAASVVAAVALGVLAFSSRHPHPVAVAAARTEVANVAVPVPPDLAPPLPPSVRTETVPVPSAGPVAVASSSPRPVSSVSAAAKAKDRPRAAAVAKPGADVTPSAPPASSAPAPGQPRNYGF